MRARVLTGSKIEIAESVARINGEIHEVIVFVEETSDSAVRPPETDIFVEMEGATVAAGGADYSRESLYAGMEGE